MKTTFQKLYDEGLFGIYANSDEVLRDFLFNTGRRPDLEEGNVVIQLFY